MDTQHLHELNKELFDLKRRLHDKNLVFDSILDSTLAGYWDWYIQEETEYLSPTFKSMFGYEDHELPNHPDTWQQIIHPDDLKGVYKIFEQHIESKGKVPYDNEVRYYHKNGSIVWVYCRGKVIEWGENGEPIRMVGCHVDITKLKEAEATEKYARELEFKNKELEQFAYVASHDLQEPLRTLTSFTDLLQRDYGNSLDAKGEKYVKYISQASNRMSTLVQGLLEYSRLGYEKELKSVDMQQLMNQVLADLGSKIEQTKAKVKVNKLPTVNGYEMELRLLFQNLISNSIKFQAEGNIPQIEIDAIQNKNEITFFVKDNGIGIPTDQHEKIFIIFQRLHKREAFEGTGIGLAHCQKVADMHDGTIWVESELWKGSTFYLSIPNQ